MLILSAAAWVVPSSLSPSRANDEAIFEDDPQFNVDTLGFAMSDFKLADSHPTDERAQSEIISYWWRRPGLRGRLRGTI